MLDAASVLIGVMLAVLVLGLVTRPVERRRLEQQEWLYRQLDRRGAEPRDTAPDRAGGRRSAAGRGIGRRRVPTSPAPRHLRAAGRHLRKKVTARLPAPSYPQLILPDGAGALTYG